MLKGFLRVFTGFGVGVFVLSYNIDSVLEQAAREINKEVARIAAGQRPYVELVPKKDKAHN